MRRGAMRCARAMLGTADDAQLTFVKVCRHQGHTLKRTVRRPQGCFTCATTFTDRQDRKSP